MTNRRWTDAQFDEMSWHDNYVHALRIVEGEFGAGELLLDMDHILEWIQESGQCKFQIQPVELRFTEVTRLRISLDYASWSLALGPFSINAVERRTEVRERYTAQLWSIGLNSPQGEISFEASGFEQIGRGIPRLSTRQYLSSAERGSC